MDQLRALYLSDFYLKDKRTLNTLILFYDQLFFHDFFGGLTTGMLYADDISGKTVFKEFYENKIFSLNGFIQRGVLQGFRGSRIKKIRSTYIERLANDYKMFFMNNRTLIEENIISFCFSSRNPHLPFFYPDKILCSDEECSKDDCEKAYEEIRELNKLCCLFEEKNHGLPLISDSSEDLVKWDKSKNQLMHAFISSAFIAQVPTLNEAHPEDVLNCREKLSGHLSEFRNEVLKISWDISQASKNSSKEEVESTAKLYYETRVDPIIKDLTEKLTKDNTKLFNKVLEKGIDKTMLIFKAIDPTEKASKWDLLGEGLKTVFQIENAKIEYEKNCSPFEYLVRLPLALRS